jgi:hypothetical protein
MKASLSLYSVVVVNQPKKMITINTRNWQSIPQENKTSRGKKKGELMHIS